MAVGDGEASAAGGPPAGLAGRAAEGVAWSAAQKWVIRITGLATIAILTRLLTPADFGVVAIALALLPLIQVLSDLGFSAYLVQADRPDARTVSTAFWFSAGAGVTLSAGLIAIAHPVAGSLGVPEAAPVIQGLAPAALAVTLGSVPIALLRRALRFRAIAVQAVVAGAAGQAVAVLLAVLGLGVWALVAQTVVYQVLATALAWGASGWRPNRAFSGARLREMTRFGAKVVGVELVSMIRVWAENLVVIAFLGPAGLGYLHIAQRLVQIAQDLTTSALVPVSTVVFAQLRASAERLRAGYVRAVGVSYALVVPIMLVLAVAGPWLLPLLFGGQWSESVVPAQLLALAGVFTLGALDHGLFYGLGRPGAWFGYAVLVEAVALAVTALAAPHGLVAIATGALAVALTATVARWAMVGRLLRAPGWTVAGPAARVLLPAAPAGTAGLLLATWLRDATAWVALPAIVLTVLAVYLPLLRLAACQTWRELHGLASTTVRRIGRAGRASAADVSAAP
ncbi:lipopolysaccharide biosynthesis protein [Microbacterium album]|uniref:Polysaccharide biosynthesis protein n=1 Tax=Microbacterium album TaxID=2053191 RepID=A0A917IH75_9MICO|nr:lipopolysaccharide biosynthesis protein [Microbacterium album]GGH49047.1 polysaccharide biosynthesis protein [Microbacterium album]